MQSLFVFIIYITKLSEQEAVLAHKWRLKTERLITAVILMAHNWGFKVDLEMTTAMILTAMAKEIKVYFIKYPESSFETYFLYSYICRLYLITNIFVCIVSNEEQEERASNQTTAAVILVIAWCLVAIIAFFYYKQTQTGIKNDILFLDYIPHDMLDL